jgi:hypothetical protein
MEKNLNLDFVLNIGIYLFDKFKLFNITIDNYKISNLIRKGKIDINKIKQSKPINKDILKSIKDNEYKIEYFKLEGYFSTFNTVLSSWIYATINSVIPILIASKIDGQYINDIKFLNTNENKINIKLNCIISIKMVNIINILHYMKKKGGKQNYGKSSDRRSYAYSNE